MLNAVFPFVVLLASQNDLPPESFKDYRKFVFEKDYALFVDPKLEAKISDSEIGKRIEDPMLQRSKFVELLLGSKRLFFAFTTAPSADPAFSVLVDENNKFRETGTIGASRLFVSSAGNLYSEGHCNTNFNERRKYTISKSGEILEVAQPFLLVGENCTLLREFEMRTMPNNKGSVVAILPPKSSIRAIIGEYYAERDARGEHVINLLIASPFGLVGWIVVRPGIAAPKEVSCIFFNGD